MVLLYRNKLLRLRLKGQLFYTVLHNGKGGEGTGASAKVNVYPGAYSQNESSALVQHFIPFVRISIPVVQLLHPQVLMRRAAIPGAAIYKLYLAFLVARYASNSSLEKLLRFIALVSPPFCAASTP